MDKIISKIYTKGKSVQFDVDNINLERKWGKQTGTVQQKGNA